MLLLCCLPLARVICLRADTRSNQLAARRTESSTFTSVWREQCESRLKKMQFQRLKHINQTNMDSQTHKCLHRFQHTSEPHPPAQPPLPPSFKMSIWVGIAMRLPAGAVAGIICVHYICSSDVSSRANAGFGVCVWLDLFVLSCQVEILHSHFHVGDR